MRVQRRRESSGRRRAIARSQVCGPGKRRWPGATLSAADRRRLVLVAADWAVCTVGTRMAARRPGAQPLLPRDVPSAQLGSSAASVTSAPDAGAPSMPLGPGTRRRRL